MPKTKSAMAGLAALLATASPAFAQKSADTIRIAINDMFPLVDPYNFPQDEQTSFNISVYQGLVSYDEHNGKYITTLAKSYRRLDDKTLEFEIKEGVKFHNGETLTSDDFKATYEWAADDKTRIRFKENFNWLDKVEVLSPTKFRIHSKRVNQGDLFRFAYSMKVLSKKAMDSMESATEYGRLAPFGTGPYKVVSLDKTKGVVVERFDGYRNDPDDYFRAPVKRVHGIPIPDRQSQQAQLITGGLDIIRNVPSDSADELAEDAEPRRHGDAERLPALCAARRGGTFAEQAVQGRTGPQGVHHGARPRLAGEEHHPGRQYRGAPRHDLLQDDAGLQGRKPSLSLQSDRGETSDGRSGPFERRRHDAVRA